MTRKSTLAREFQPSARTRTSAWISTGAAGSPNGPGRHRTESGLKLEAMRSAAMEPRSVSTTKAPPPSRTAPTRRTVSVPTGSAPSRTTMAKAPDLRSTSAQRSALVRSAACTTSGAPSVQPKVSVPDASTHAARSPAAVTPRQAERNTAAAPPAGAQTVSLPRGNPPCGSARSSVVSPVVTACASRFASRSASGFALGKRSAISCRRASTWADIRRRACHHETRTRERQERGS